MNLHLAEISGMVSPGKHAVLLLDQAGWHLSGDVAVPDNITLLPLPPKCPELNVMENVWQFMRDNWLSNRVFRDHDGVEDGHRPHRRPLLPPLEPPDRAAIAHHVHRPARMGAWVLISRSWYNTQRRKS
jgi:hypothetical protein